MGLTKYRAKRDFAKTPEPRGRTARGTKRKLRYVIQKHAATRLHYDFRLELDGVLKSWAVPKGPSYDPAEKRLAVEVEDHPIEYGTFEGTIPKGEYGGGTVLLWDRGTWTPIKEPELAFARGLLEFRLDGEKLVGGWNLVRMGGRAAQEGRPNWLLIKSRDGTERPKAKAEITAERPESVASGRSLEQIAAGVGKKRVWHSNRAFEGGHDAKPAVKSAHKAARKTATRTNGSPRGARPRTPQKARTRRARAKAPDPTDIEGARRAPLPQDAPPQLATLVDTAPQGEGWLHEIKFDGYRVLCHVTGGKVRWMTRRGNDWTARFRSLSPELEALPVKSAILDGEVVVLRPDGTTSFQDLQNALGGEDHALSLFLFDLLYLDGWDLRGAVLEERKRALEALCASLPAGSSVRYSDHVEGKGADFHAQACRHGLEGIISKRRDQPYRGARTLDWQKTKCNARQEFVVGGWTDPQGARSGLGALLIGVYGKDKELRYAGKVGSGYGHDTLIDLKKRLAKLAQREPPFVDAPFGARARGVHWVAPKLVVEVEFTGWTQDGRLRHPTFQGLREDKKPTEVVREKPVGTAASSRAKPSVDRARNIFAARDGRAASERRTVQRTSDEPPEPGRKNAHKTGAHEPIPKARRGPRTARAPSAAGANRGEEVADVRLTHPDRVLWPETGFTKLDLARYYIAVADRMLPQIAGRPISIVRCPEGRAKPCFFQRHAGEGVPSSIKTVAVAEERGRKPYLMVDSLAGLVGLVQIGALEIHPWGARADKIDFPDRIVFDLDPDPAAGWALVVEYARRVRERLADLGLESFLKTTGGKGLHVVVPLQRKQSWDVVKPFAEQIAKGFAREDPARVIAVASKAARKGKVFIDWLRNARGASAIAPYSTRARENAPVAMPLAWEELSARLRPDQFTVENAAVRLKKADPWKRFDAIKQSLTASMVKASGVTSHPSLHSNRK